MVHPADVMADQTETKGKKEKGHTTSKIQEKASQAAPKENIMEEERGKLVQDRKMEQLVAVLTRFLKPVSMLVLERMQGFLVLV